MIGGDSLQYSTADGLQTQTFDHVFAHDASQEEVYVKVGQPVVDQCLKGYNGAILCYGQTSSGKVGSSRADYTAHPHRACRRAPQLC